MQGPIRDIFLHKPVPEGTTAVAPTSPINNVAGSPSPSTAGVILMGYGAMAAKRVFSIATAEIAANGNERLATRFSNIAEGAGRLTLIIGTQGLAAIPMAIEGISGEYTRYADRNRENQQKAIEAAEKGVRIGYGTGSAYYD